MPEGPRFSFHPLNRRGVLLGLGAGQMSAVAGGLIAGVVLHGSIGGPPGTAVGVLVAGGSAVAAGWTRDHRPVGAWGLDWLGLTARRTRGPSLDRRPTGGRRDLRPAGIDLVADPGGPGDRPVAMVHDRRAGTVAAVVPVGGSSFSLLDAGAQARHLDGWRRALGTLARPGTPVVRLQWVQRSSTAGPAVAERILASAPAGSSPAEVSYRRLVAGSVAAMPVHESWIVVAVGRGRARHREAAERLRRELRLLEGQLRAAELHPGPPLGLDQLNGLIAGASEARRDRRSGGWPMAMDEGWSVLRADGSWHATFWVAEWPRVDVGPEFLSPLLLTDRRVSASVIMAPLSPDRAMREARAARTADAADAELRARAGFLPSARRQREREGADALEAELADGHSEFRYSGYVTVSAGDPEELAASCAEVEHAAQIGHIELRRLFGRQAEAFTWTLPLARGLR